MSWQFERVAGPFAFTEGPAWDGAGVLFTDIPNSRIMRYDPSSGETAEARTGTQQANGLMFDQSGLLFACEGGGRRIALYDGERTISIVDRYEGKRFNSPNDLAFDSEGRLWFTDPRYGAEDDLELTHQSVYRCDPADGGAWSLTRASFDTTKPNGLLVSPDCKTLYVAQSEYGEGRLRELRAYPILEDGSVGEYETLHNFYPHRGIDGMCLDSEGRIVATAGWEESGPGPMIYVFEPSGRVLETHPIEAKPTNCTWGGDDLQTLYVTAGGCLYRAETDLRGFLIYPSDEAAQGYLL